MKLNVEIDCTPAEARAFLGLPDVSSLNEHLVAEMKKRMPFSDFSEFDKNPSIETADSLLNVDTVVNYIQSKVG